MHHDLRPCFSWTRGRLSEMVKVLLQWFCHKKNIQCTNNGFNVLTFYQVVYNYHYKCVCFSACKGKFYGNFLWKFLKKYPPPFIRKMLMSAFLLTFMANYIEKNVWLSSFFFVDSNSPWKDLLSTYGHNLGQRALYLVRTVLNIQFYFHWLFFIADGY